MKYQSCEYINARELTDMFHDAIALIEFDPDSERYGCPPAACEAKDYLHVWLGHFEDPDCLDDDCSCSSETDNSLNEDDSINCNYAILDDFGLHNLSKKTLHQLITRSLRNVGEKTKGEYRIFPPESLCFCGECNQIELDSLIYPLMRLLAFRVSTPEKVDKTPKTPEKTFSPKNKGVQLEKLRILQELCNGKVLMVPGDVIVSYNKDTLELTIDDGVEKQPLKSDLPRLIALALNDELDETDASELKEVLDSIGDKKYPNSTIDADYVNGEATSYKSKGATLLDPTSNHMLFFGEEIDEDKADAIIDGTDGIAKAVHDLNAIYMMKPEDRPTQIHTKRDMYLSVFPVTSMVFVDGESFDECDLRLAKGALITETDFRDKMEGFSKRFGKNTESLIPLASNAFDKKSKLFAGSGMPRRILRNGVFEDITKSDLVEATKVLALSPRVKEDESVGKEAENVTFLHKVGSKVEVSLEISKSDSSEKWLYLADNLYLDTQSGCRNHLGVLRDKEGRLFPFLSSPLQIRIDRKFNPLLCAMQGLLAA